MNYIKRNYGLFPLRHKFSPVCKAITFFKISVVVLLFVLFTALIAYTLQQQRVADEAIQIAMEYHKLINDDSIKGKIVMQAPVRIDSKKIKK